MSEKDLVKRINSKYGEGTIVKMSQTKPALSYNPEEFLSTGSYRFNKILSGHHNFGIKINKIAEVFGPEQSGKTTTTLHLAAEAAKREIETFFIDAENALDIDYAHSIGVKDEYFNLLTPECGEDCFDIACDEILPIKKPKLLIFDSVTAMTPLAIIDGSMQDSHMGVHARMMSQGLSKFNNLLKRSNTWVVFINQLRMKIGVFFGNPETTTGGNALKFYTSYRWDVRSPRGGAIKENVVVDEKGEGSLSDSTKGTRVLKKSKKAKAAKKKKVKKENLETGIVMKVKVVKNKVAPPFRKAEIKIDYGKGIDKDDDLLKFLEDSQILTLPTKAKVTYKGKTYTRKTFLPKLYGDFKKEINAQIRKVNK
jgi:recombination protein RecA